MIFYFYLINPLYADIFLASASLILCMQQTYNGKHKIFR